MRALSVSRRFLVGRLGYSSVAPRLLLGQLSAISVARASAEGVSVTRRLLIGSFSAVSVTLRLEILSIYRLVVGYLG